MQGKILISRSRNIKMKMGKKEGVGVSGSSLIIFLKSKEARRN